MCVLCFLITLMYCAWRKHWVHFAQCYLIPENLGRIKDFPAYKIIIRNTKSLFGMLLPSQLFNCAEKNTFTWLQLEKFEVNFKKKVIFVQSYRYCGYFCGTVHMHIKRQKLCICVFLLSHKTFMLWVLKFCNYAPAYFVWAELCWHMEWEVYVILCPGQIFTELFSQWLKSWKIRNKS